jgi:hypothetical protein
MSGKKGKSGGKRKGAGAPKKTRIYPDSIKENFIKAAAMFKKEHGKSIEEYILNLLADDKFHPTAKAAIAKLYFDVLVPKVQEKNINIGENQRGPVIYEHDPEGRMYVVGGDLDSPEIFLPKEKKDPAKVIQKKPDKVILMEGRKKPNE